MTEINIDAIRQREQAATEGPWIPGGFDVAQTWRRVVAGLATNTGNHAADFAFIAHARQDIPGLLAKVDELTADLARARAGHRSYFDGPTDRQLLIAVRGWAYANGWVPSQHGWSNHHYDGDATLAVGWDEDGVRIWRKEPAAGGTRHYWPNRSTDYPVSSVRQAVDVLVALDVLPAYLSSAYRTRAVAQ